MNIAILGYGKMGKAVERIAGERGHQTRIIDIRAKPVKMPEEHACAIEFTHAGIVQELIQACIDAKIPIVSGTTGWDAERASVNSYCQEKNGTFLWSPNFSIGMHLVFEINSALARLMAPHTEYDIEILETHHTEKKDKPSGTAIALANQIIAEVPRKSQWALNEGGVLPENVLAVTSERIPDVKGIHRVTYKGPHDVISLRHKALSRDAFALGAVISAEWLVGKTGVFTFKEVLGL